MYFWKINKLKEDLKSNSVSNKDIFKYYLVLVIAYLVLPILKWSGTNLWDRALDVQLLVISVAGTTYCYIMNGGKRGPKFIERLVSLTWVLTIRMVVIILPILILIYIMLSIIIFKAGNPQSTWLDLIFELLFFAIFYMKLGREIKNVAT